MKLLEDETEDPKENQWHRQLQNVHHNQKILKLLKIFQYHHSQKNFLIHLKKEFWSESFLETSWEKEIKYANIMKQNLTMHYFI